MWKHPVDSEGHVFTAGLSVAICQNLEKTRHSCRRLTEPSRFSLISTSARVPLSHSTPFSRDTSSVVTSLRLLGSWVLPTFLQVGTTDSPLRLLPSSSWTGWSIPSSTLVSAITSTSLFFYPAYPQLLISSTTIFLHSSLRQPSATEGNYTFHSLMPLRTRFPASLGPLALPLLPGHIRLETLPTHSQGRALT